MSPKKYLMTYNLKTAYWNYTGFYSGIQNLGPWWHYFDSTWIVKTSYNAQQVYNILAPHISKNDLLLIIEIVPGSRYGWLPQDAWNWIDN